MFQRFPGFAQPTIHAVVELQRVQENPEPRRARLFISSLSESFFVEIQGVVPMLRHFTELFAAELAREYVAQTLEKREIPNLLIAGGLQRVVHCDEMNEAPPWWSKIRRLDPLVAEYQRQYPVGDVLGRKISHWLSH